MSDVNVPAADGSDSVNGDTDVIDAGVEQASTQPATESSDDAGGPNTSRRTLMKGIGATAAGGALMSHEDLSPVQEADAIAPIVPIFIAGAVLGTGITATYVSLGDGGAVENATRDAKVDDIQGDMADLRDDISNWTERERDNVGGDFSASEPTMESALRLKYRKDNNRIIHDGLSKGQSRTEIKNRCRQQIKDTISKQERDLLTIWNSYTHEHWTQHMMAWKFSSTSDVDPTLNGALPMFNEAGDTTANVNYDDSYGTYNEPAEFVDSDMADSIVPRYEHELPNGETVVVETMVASTRDYTAADSVYAQQIGLIKPTLRSTPDSSGLYINGVKAEDSVYLGGGVSDDGGLTLGSHEVTASRSGQYSDNVSVDNTLTYTKDGSGGTENMWIATHSGEFEIRGDGVIYPYFDHQEVWNTVDDMRRLLDKGARMENNSIDEWVDAVYDEWEAGNLDPNDLLTMDQIMSQLNTDVGVNGAGFVSTGMYGRLDKSGVFSVNGGESQTGYLMTRIKGLRVKSNNIYESGSLPSIPARSDVISQIRALGGYDDNTVPIETDMWVEIEQPDGSGGTETVTQTVTDIPLDVDQTVTGDVVVDASTHVSNWSSDKTITRAVFNITEVGVGRSGTETRVTRQVTAGDTITTTGAGWSLGDNPDAEFLAEYCELFGSNEGQTSITHLNDGDTITLESVSGDSSSLTFKSYVAPAENKTPAEESREMANDQAEEDPIVVKYDNSGLGSDIGDAVGTAVDDATSDLINAIMGPLTYLMYGGLGVGGLVALSKIKDLLSDDSGGDVDLSKYRGNQ